MRAKRVPGLSRSLFVGVTALAMLGADAGFASRPADDPETDPGLDVAAVEETLRPPTVFELLLAQADVEDDGARARRRRRPRGRRPGGSRQGDAGQERPPDSS